MTTPRSSSPVDDPTTLASLGLISVRDPATGLHTWRREVGSQATVVLLHSIALHADMWAPMVAALPDEVSVVAVDLPGHGRSAPPAQGWDLGDVATAVVDGCGSTSGLVPVGISMGGMVAQHIALDHPDAVIGLVIGDCGDGQEPERRGMMRERADRIEREGMDASLLSSTLERWFSPEARQDRPGMVAAATASLEALDPEVHAWAWRCIADLDTRHRLGEIRAPTRVLCGERDASTPPDRVAEVAERIRGADFVEIDDAGHLSVIEQPDAWAASVRVVLRDATTPPTNAE